MTKEELAKQQISIKLPVKEEEALPVIAIARILNLDISNSQLSSILTKLANRKKAKYNGKYRYVFWRNVKKERTYENTKFGTRDISKILKQKILSVIPTKEEEAITGKEITKQVNVVYGVKRASTTVGDYLTGLYFSGGIKRKIENSESRTRPYVYWVADEGKSEKEAEEGENIKPNEISIDTIKAVFPSDFSPKGSLPKSHENVSEHTDRMGAMDNWLKRVNELHNVNEELREALVRCGKRENTLRGIADNADKDHVEVERLKKELVGKSKEIIKLKEERMDHFAIQAEERVKSDIAESRKILEHTFKG